MLLQSYRDESDIGNLKKFNTPAAPGTVLKKPDEGEESLTPEKQTQYCSGVGKRMHMMRYSRPDTYNAVCNLARHMTRATQVHYDAMLRMMKYVYDIQRKSGTEARNTSSLSVVEVILTTQKIHRRKRASPDTGYF